MGGDDLECQDNNPGDDNDKETNHVDTELIPVLVPVLVDTD